MSDALSFGDWRRRGSLASRPQRHRSIAPTGRVEAGPVQLIDILCPAGVVVDPPVSQYVVHLVLKTPPLLRLGFNRKPRVLVMSPGVLIAAPPDTSGDYDAAQPSRVLSIAIPKVHVAESDVRIDIRREENFRSPRLAGQLMHLWDEVADDAPADQLLADQVMREVIDALARRTDARAPSRLARERLSPFVLRRVCDHVEAHLADEVDVHSLATVAGSSMAHFARAFAATAGMTPYQYVMTRRLARAHDLLASTTRSMLDIALDTGFKTPSHFASRFRREFGLRPTEIRADTRRRSE